VWLNAILPGSWNLSGGRRFTSGGDLPEREASCARRRPLSHFLACIAGEVCSFMHAEELSPKHRWRRKIASLNDLLASRSNLPGVGFRSRTERYQLRLVIQNEQAHHLRLPWLSMVDAPADLPASKPETSCAWLQRKGNNHDPFDIRVQNKLDRFHQEQDVVERLPNLGPRERISRR
jgi:hypothetical protein